MTSVAPVPTSWSGTAPAHGRALQVAAVETLADGVVGLRLTSPGGGGLPAWAPGSHIEVEIGRGIVRHYSLCGRPDDEDQWRIAVLREPESRGGSAFIHDRVRPGDTITCRAVRNNFGLVEADRYLFVAGGIGITPVLPMVRSVAAAGSPWALLYGGRTRTSMAFVDDVLDVPGGHVSVVPQDTHGMLDLDGFLRSPDEKTVVYCCGPGPLLEAVEQRCTSWPDGALHLERFRAPAASPVSGDEFDVYLARSERRLHVPPHSTVLEVLEEAGYELTNSCRGGICGTCLVDVLDGVPDHRDDVLTDDERASNRVMLPCVSRSTTNELVIDL